MTGACTINGFDIATLGALILRGGDNGFIAFPTRKEPVIIEWPDRDGFEIGDDDPVFEARKFTVDYYLKGNETTFLNRLIEFANLHFSSGVHFVYVREFSFTFQLRFSAISSIKINRGLTVTGEKSARIGIDYIMDNPTQFFNDFVTVPTVNREPLTQVEINETDLAAYGIIVKEVYPTALKVTHKPGIVYNSRYANGSSVIYPSGVKNEKQNITISCAMVCADRIEFLENWNALWVKLAIASLTIGLVAAEKSYTAYFAGMSNFNKRPWTNRAFAEFDLNFVGFES